MPIYDHDCPHCRYLGSDAPQPGEPVCNSVDMYICTKGREPKAIRRYSSKLDDYSCRPFEEIKGGRYAAAKQAAIEQGIV